jgi:hypothetical protein
VQPLVSKILLGQDERPRIDRTRGAHGERNRLGESVLSNESSIRMIGTDHRGVGNSLSRTGSLPNPCPSDAVLDKCV